MKPDVGWIVPGVNHWWNKVWLEYYQSSHWSNKTWAHFQSLQSWEALRFSDWISKTRVFVSTLLRLRHCNSRVCALKSDIARWIPQCLQSFSHSLPPSHWAVRSAFRLPGISLLAFFVNDSLCCEETKRAQTALPGCTEGCRFSGLLNSWWRASGLPLWISQMDAVQKQPRPLLWRRSVQDPTRAVPLLHNASIVEEPTIFLSMQEKRISNCICRMFDIEIHWLISDMKWCFDQTSKCNIFKYRIISSH